MPCAIFDYIGAFLRNGFVPVDNIIPVIKKITWLLLSGLPGNKLHRNSPGPSEPCLRNLHQHVPELSGTLRNLPRPSGINLSEPSGTFLRNLHQHTPELSGTFRNLPPAHTGAYLGNSDPISFRWGKSPIESNRFVFRTVAMSLYPLVSPEPSDFAHFLACAKINHFSDLASR